MANPHLAGENAKVQGRGDWLLGYGQQNTGPTVCILEQSVLQLCAGRTPSPREAVCPNRWGPVPVASKKALTPEESGGEAEKQGGAYQAARQGQPRALRHCPGYQQEGEHRKSQAD